MKKIALYLLTITIIMPHYMFAVPNIDKETTQKKQRKGTISFDFKDEELIDVINRLAALKGVNIVFPTGDKAIKQKITYSPIHPLTLNEAWNELYTILDIAGYSLIKKNGLYTIVKNSQNISREPLPIYINTALNEIPDTDERIIYIYYLTNLSASVDFDTQLGLLFKELLPPDAIYKANKSANGLLIAAKAQDIRSIMHIVDAMDQTGFQERLEVIRLRYTAADTIANMFNDSILKTGSSTPNRLRPAGQTDASSATYFSLNIRVIAEPRTNSLVVLGRVQAVERVKDFIFKYIDTQLESGNSILHIYELQYLDADEFAPVLQRIIDSSRPGGTGQSSGGSNQQSGTERFFDNVIVRSDSPAQASEEASEGKYSGGNKLVIAARNDDWKRIRVLIESLDKPQPQVIVEVLIADLTMTDARSIGNIIRNPSSLPFPGTASAQAAMIDQVVLDATAQSDGTTGPTLDSLLGVNSDLNAVTVVPTTVGATGFVSLPQNADAGTTVISASDCNGRTWTTLELLQQLSPIRILTHPHIIATNNVKASIEVGETRLVTDQAAPSTSGVTVRNNNLTANTSVQITPRISSANTVNLQVVIDINKFLFPNDLSNGDRITRNLVTNATIKSNDILSLGGLISDEVDDGLQQTPILSQIPIIGWLFKQQARTKVKTSLNIFITPIIVMPKLREGVSSYTRANAQSAKEYTETAPLFDNLRDPITRWFFYSTTTTASVIEHFLEKDTTRDLTHPEDEFVPEDENNILDNPAAYDHSGRLKEILSIESNPLEDNRGSGELASLLPSIQQKESGNKPRIQPKPQPIKAAPIKAKIIPPANQPANSTEKKSANSPSKAKTIACPAPTKKSCPVQAKPMAPPACNSQTTQAPTEPKKWPPRKAKQELKTMLTQENNPLTTQQAPVQ